MPEGDVVWRTARTLHQALAGDPLTGADLRVPALATVDLRGRVVQEVVSRGKHLLIRLAPDLTVHAHLRMDGSWRLYRAGARWTGGPGHQIRVVLTTARYSAVGYRVHDLAVLARRDESTLVGHLGPDLLGPDWDREEALRRLLTNPGATIGEALLDQRNLAGIGNLFKCEALFVSGVHPWTAVGRVRDLAGVVDRARRMLVANRSRLPQTTTGDTARGREHYVYGRGGQPCRRCGATVLRAEQGPALTERVTFWCPVCQPPAADPGPA